MRERSSSTEPKASLRQPALGESESYRPRVTFSANTTSTKSWREGGRVIPDGPHGDRPVGRPHRPDSPYLIHRRDLVPEHRRQRIGVRTQSDGWIPMPAARPRVCCKGTRPSPAQDREPGADQLSAARVGAVSSRSCDASRGGEERIPSPSRAQDSKLDSTCMRLHRSLHATKECRLSRLCSSLHPIASGSLHAPSATSMAGSGADRSEQCRVQDAESVPVPSLVCFW